ncbi:MAG: hypothetical protein GX308_07260 [Epulopiscium sp.]|nr:hypothetical protein [Candidatus Epulonipiscium sp.]
MRKYKMISVEKEMIEEVYCNICGEKIEKDIHNHFEDYLHIEKTWGYNSERDGQKDDFDVCQHCYKKWIKTFKLPI